jgi:hypothetical protein
VFVAWWPKILAGMASGTNCWSERGLLESEVETQVVEFPKFLQMICMLIKEFNVIAHDPANAGRGELFSFTENVGATRLAMYAGHKSCIHDFPPFEAQLYVVVYVIHL